jgi:hypothetical protein
MSKAIKSVGNVVGSVVKATPLGQLVNGVSKGTKVSYDGAPNDDYARYLAQYDTSKVDNTLSNLQDYALRQSKNLGNLNYNMPTISKSEWNVPQVRESDWNFNTADQDWYMPTVNKKDWYMPKVSRNDYVSPEVNRDDWTYDVNASEKARQQAQNATYNSYMDRLNPQFERQTADYATMLQQKGIPIGSEAYDRAMSDLQDRQNAAVNQAAYQSVLAGQDAYSQSLADQIAAGNFNNNAVNSYYNTTLAAHQAQNQAQNDYLNAQLAANQNQIAFNDAQLAANTAREAHANALLRDNDARAAFYNAQQGANDARSGYIDAQNAVNNAQSTLMAQILAALGGAPNEYDIQGDIYAARANKAANEYATRQQTVENRVNLVNGLLGAGAKVAGASGAKSSAK